MLYPQNNTTRTMISLDGFWRFAPDYNNEGEDYQWHKGIPYDREIGVPASWNEQCQDLMHFFETGWYEKEVEIPEIFKDQTLYLRFGSVNYLAKVWINGEYVGQHEGGHLPFEFDVTSFIKFGVCNIITVSVDARLMPDRLPPGQVQDEMIVGFKGQYPENNCDFFPYSGIHRPVILYGVEDTHITDIKVETNLEEKDGILNYEVILNKEFTGEVKVSLDEEVFESYNLENKNILVGTMKVNQVRPWSMEDPYLYHLRIELYDKDQKIDCYRLKVGIRTVEIKGCKLLLNGKEVFLQGFGMHEDFSVLGKGLNHSVIVKDFNLLEWIGANSLRTSHYPYSEEFLNYADSKGILVIGETPFVGFVRSQYNNPEIWKKVKKVIKEMIERDRNHPSIIGWSLANEGDTFVPEADKFYKNMYDYAKSIDSTRPITITNCIDVEEDVALKHYDFISINRYYGWYEQVGRLDQGCELLDQKLDRCYEIFKKPIIVTEFGADAMAGLHMDPPEEFSEEYQAEMVVRQYDIIRSKPYAMGAHIWAFADFKTSQTPSRVVLNRKGLFTRERQPKLAAHKIRDKWKTQKEG